MKTLFLPLLFLLLLNSCWECMYDGPQTPSLSVVILDKDSVMTRDYKYCYAAGLNKAKVKPSEYDFDLDTGILYYRVFNIPLNRNSDTSAVVFERVNGTMDTIRFVYNRKLEVQKSCGGDVMDIRIYNLKADALSAGLDSSRTIQNYRDYNFWFTSSMCFFRK